MTNYKRYETITAWELREYIGKWWTMKFSKSEWGQIYDWLIRENHMRDICVWDRVIFYVNDIWSTVLERKYFDRIEIEQPERESINDKVIGHVSEEGTSKKYKDLAGCKIIEDDRNLWPIPDSRSERETIQEEQIVTDSHELKEWDLCYVSNVSEEDALEREQISEFYRMYKKYYECVTPIRRVCSHREYAVPIPKEDKTPDPDDYNWEDYKRVETWENKTPESKPEEREEAKQIEKLDPRIDTHSIEDEVELNRWKTNELIDIVNKHLLPTKDPNG